MIVETQAMRFARQMAHSIHVFSEGRIVESEPPEQVFESLCQEATRHLLNETQAA